MVSDNFREAVYAQETDEAALVLLTLDHTELVEPVRVTSDGVDTTSRGELFVSFPYRLSLPVDDPEAPPQAKLEIDNVDRQIVSALRKISSPINVLIEVILSSTPNVIEAEYDDMQLRNAEYDISTVSGDLTVETFLQEPFPAGIFDPARFPGGF